MEIKKIHLLGLSILFATILSFYNPPSALAISCSQVEAGQCRSSSSCSQLCTATGGPTDYTDCSANQICCDTGCMAQTTSPSDSNTPGFSSIEDQGLPNFRFSETNQGNVASLIFSAIPWVFAFAGSLLLIYLLYGGFHLMISGGDPKVVQEARGKITNAITGFLIIFVAFWIVQIIARIFGLQKIVDIFG